MKRTLRWCMVAVIPALLLGTPLPVAAQTSSSPPPQSPVCMARANDLPDSQQIVIVIPAGQQAAIEARGYAAHACLDDPAAVANYRTKICQFADNAPQAVQDRFARVNNVSPRELCAMVTSVGQ